MKLMPGGSVDSLVTDPPAGISFMGLDFDKDKGGRDKWIAWLCEIMTEAKRLLKPGAHGLVWALPRTSHWTMMALENAGFEIRDVIHHIHGQGFPKSLNLSNGLGTALKPACEHWILIRKPIEEKTIAENVLKYGTGALNIDVCRVSYTKENAPQGGYGKMEIGIGHPAETMPMKNDNKPSAGRRTATFGTQETIRGGEGTINWKPSDIGRFPSNLTHDGSPEVLDEMGRVSSFFYQAKPSKKEKDKGLESFPIAKIEKRTDTAAGSFVEKGLQAGRNTHPTVKSVELMKYFIKLITPENGIVLDCFTGSGSTGVSALSLGRRFIGIEQSSEYFSICQFRMKSAI